MKNIKDIIKLFTSVEEFINHVNRMKLLQFRSYRGLEDVMGDEFVRAIRLCMQSNLVAVFAGVFCSGHRNRLNNFSSLLALALDLGVKKAKKQKGFFQTVLDYMVQHDMGQVSEFISFVQEEYGFEISVQAGSDFSGQHVRKTYDLGDHKVILDVEVGDNNMVSYGTRKFILTQVSHGGLAVILSNRYGYHYQINQGHKGIRSPFGGGWFTMDFSNKTISIFDSSGDFGVEPRLITVSLLRQALPDYTITCDY